MTEENMNGNSDIFTYIIPSFLVMAACLFGLGCLGIWLSKQEEKQKKQITCQTWTIVTQDTQVLPMPGMQKGRLTDEEKRDLEERKAKMIQKEWYIFEEEEKENEQK